MIEETTEIEQDATVDKAKNDRDIHERALKRIKRSMDDDSGQLAEANADLRFLAGEHWDPIFKAARENDHLPCLVLDFMDEKIAQVVGDIRQNKSAAQVEPVDDDADPDTADIFNDHIRAIRRNSESNMIRENAAESAVTCGRGVYRILTEYESERSRNQIITMKWVQNISSVGFDPGAQDYNKQDGQFMYIWTDYEKEDYETLFPGRTGTTLPEEPQYPSELIAAWKTTEKIRVAEYFERTDRKYTIVQLDDGRVVPLKGISKEDKAQISLRPNGKPYQRETAERIITWYKIDGQGIIEGPIIFPSQWFPFLFIWGKETNINGVRYVRGMVRNGKDAQRMIDYWESKTTEVVALAPTAPYIGTAAQFAGHEKEYQAAARGENIGMLTYNRDPQFPADKPERIAPPSIPTGMENRAMVNKDNLKSCMGIYDSSVGAASNETSGKGILAREHQSQRGTYLYQDNMSRTERTECMILLDMIPRVYDADRTVRILGRDDKWRKVHYGRRPEGYDHKSSRPEDQIYDPLVGRYDVSIEVGPSYATQRAETRDALAQVLQGSTPQERAIVLPRLLRLMNMEDADKIAEELELLLPPEIQLALKQLRNKGKGAEEGGEIPVDQPLPLGPDGMPIPMQPGVDQVQPGAVQGQTPALPQPAPDPTQGARTAAEHAKATMVIIDMLKKAQEAGMTNAEIEAIGRQIEGIQG